MVVRFYHYTNEESLRGIRYYETILPSMTGKFGCGVYFSRLGPRDLPLDKLAVDCFGAGGEARLRKGHLNCYIEVIVRNPRKVFEKCRAAGGRDVFIFRGQMVLRHFAWRAGFVSGPTATLAPRVRLPMRWPPLQSVPAAPSSQNGFFLTPCAPRSQYGNNSPPFAHRSHGTNFPPPYTCALQNDNFAPFISPGSICGNFSPFTPRPHEGNSSPPYAMGSHCGSFPPPFTPGSHGGTFLPPFASVPLSGNIPSHWVPGSNYGIFHRPYAHEPKYNFTYSEGYDVDFSATYVGEPHNDYFSSTTFRGQSQNNCTSSPADDVCGVYLMPPPPVSEQQVKPASFKSAQTTLSTPTYSSSANNPIWDSFNSPSGKEPQSVNSLSEAESENKENKVMRGKKRKVSACWVSANRKKMNNASFSRLKNNYEVKSEVNDSGYLSDTNSSQVAGSPDMRATKEFSSTTNGNNPGNISQVINQTVEILQKVCNWVGL